MRVLPLLYSLAVLPGKLIFAEECVNSDTYRYESKSCNWVRNNEERRQEYCKIAEIVSNCPISCGICCKDDASFTINTSTGEKECKWIGKRQERKDRYCLKYIIGLRVRSSCPIACDFCKDPVLGTISPSPTVSPIQSPPICLNSNSYRYNGSSKISCNWIRTDEDRRIRYCRIAEIASNCPISCGVCCENDESFRLSTKTLDKKCSWIANSQARKDRFCSEINNGVRVRRACAAACDFCKDPAPPTSSPISSTSSPTASSIECVNSESFRFENKPKMSCNWIRNDEDRRIQYCMFEEVASSCPISCGICCKNDKKYRLNTVNGPKKCRWLAKSQERKNTFCTTFNNNAMVRSVCPVACDFCKKRVTLSPTPSPTLM